MRCHKVHTYILHSICSALAWWWLFHSRNLQTGCNWYFITVLMYICCVLDGNMCIYIYIYIYIYGNFLSFKWILWIFRDCNPFFQHPVCSMYVYNRVTRLSASRNSNSSGNTETSRSLEIFLNIKFYGCYGRCRAKHNQQLATESERTPHM